MRILVLRGGAVGDFLVTLPALRALRARWPQAVVELVGNRHAAELGVVDGCLQVVHDQHAARWSALYADSALPPDLARWLERFDLVVNFWPDSDGTLARRFASWGNRFIAGSADARANPAARQFLEAVEPLTGTPARDLAPVIRFPSSLVDAAKDRLRGIDRGVAIHAGSGSRQKTWPLERWHAVARQLQGLPASERSNAGGAATRRASLRERSILWITGEADSAARPPAGLPLVHASHWPLPLLGAALSLCDLYLGHDTGVSHLAAAAGARGVLLFGPTDPGIWAPPTPRMRVLRGAGGAIDAITVEDVLAGIPLP